MGKICNSIAQYKDIIISAGVIPGDCSPPKKTIKRFLRLFKTIDDSRVPNMVTYPLCEIALIAFLAIPANASSWAEMEDFGKTKIKWLRKFLKLEYGIPYHGTFRRVFALIDPLQMEMATVQFLLENMDRIKKSLKIQDAGYRLICVDGKEEKGTGRKHGTQAEIRNLQTLLVFDVVLQIIHKFPQNLQKHRPIPLPLIFRQHKKCG